MFINTAIASIIGAASIALLSMIPPDMSKLNMLDGPFSIPDGVLSDSPLHAASVEEEEEQEHRNLYEQAILILFFLGGSSGGAQVTSLEEPSNAQENEQVEMAGFLKRLAWIII